MYIKSISTIICIATIILAGAFSTQAQRGKTDTLILIKAPTSAQLAKQDSIKKANEQKKKEDELAKIVAHKKNTVIDSSRFIKRKTVSNKSSFASKTPFIVNRAVFGVYTDYINQYIENYQKNHGARLSRMQSSNKAYFKLIDNVMKKHNVPREMKALAIIESALNCNAVSPVGAVGTWQFMEGTAKMMGLRVDEEVDERRDIYKSTNAAARYLKKLHSIFHDWLLVIASYNCGPAPVLRAINKGNGRSFWDIKPKLPKETQNHVMAFIATNAFLDRFTPVLNMGQSPKEGSKINIFETKTKVSKREVAKIATLKNAPTKIEVKDTEESEDSIEDKPDDFKSKFSKEELDEMAILKVKGSYTLRVISAILDEDLVKLQRWNPDFDQNIITATSPIHLRLPISKIEKFIVEKEKIIAQSQKR